MMKKKPGLMIIDDNDDDKNNNEMQIPDQNFRSQRFEEEKKQPASFAQTAKYKDLRLDDQFEQLQKPQNDVKSSSRSSKSGKQSQTQSQSVQEQYQNDGSSLGSMKKGKSSPSAIPYALIEGPEPSQDLSYKWVQRNAKVEVIESGISIENFTPQFKLRDLDTEYRLLRRLTETKEHLLNQEVLEKAANKLNRYSDLKPFKHTRVRLTQRNADVYDSYINANYVNSSTGQNDQIFIATQGPLQETIENFWRMIWQEKVQLIVMLTCVKEGGKQKCDQYWPVEIEEKFTFEDSFEITLISVESVMPNLIKRKIMIQSLERSEDVRTVVHLQYMTWPDHGAPDESDNKIIQKILEFMREYHQKSKVNNNENKIVVHCSAGIGRSGTIIAIYNIQIAVELLHQNKDNLVQTAQYSLLTGDEQEIVEPRVSVFGVVRRLREQRYCMVQVQTQYEFIYDYINQWLSEKGYIKSSPKDGNKSQSSSMQKIIKDINIDE